MVAELTDRHPLVGLAPLWRRFHGLERPEGPGAGDAVAALAEAGLEVERQDWENRTGSASTTSTSWSPSPAGGCACPNGPEVAEALLAQGTHQVDGVWVSGRRAG